MRRMDESQYLPYHLATVQIMRHSLPDVWLVRIPSRCQHMHDPKRPVAAAPQHQMQGPNIKHP
jgi:hypothetical protein